MPGIDLHTHLAPSGLLPELDAPGPGTLYQPDRLAAWLDDVGLGAALVSPPPPFYRQDLAPDAARSWVRGLNDAVAELVANRPQLAPAAYLPLEHPDIALEEASRIADERRWVAVTGSAGGSSVPLDDPALEPLWTFLEDHSFGIMLHPGSSPDPRLRSHYLANLLGNPYETAVAAGQLLLGDVLGRHPDLRILLVHCGGVLAAVLPRWQRGLDTDRPGLAPLTRPLGEALRGVWVDALAHDPELIKLALHRFGADRLVLGSDWPFPMGSADPKAAVIQAVGEPHTAVEAGNAIAFLGERSPWRPTTAIQP